MLPSERLKIIERTRSNVEAIKRAGGPLPEHERAFRKLERSLEYHERALQDQELGFFGVALAVVGAVAGIYTLYAAFKVSEKIRSAIEDVAGPASKVVIWGLAGITLYAAAKWADPKTWRGGGGSSGGAWG